MTRLIDELIEIGKLIDEGHCSWGELAYLQSNKQAVLNYGDAHLCEQAGITEEEYNNGKLNPDLSFEEDFIKLEIENDGECNAMCTIKIDDNDSLTLTSFEMVNLMTILREHHTEIEEYFQQLEEEYKSRQ